MDKLNVPSYFLRMLINWFLKNFLARLHAVAKCSKPEIDSQACLLLDLDEYFQIVVTYLLVCCFLYRELSCCYTRNIMFMVFNLHNVRFIELECDCCNLNCSK